MSCWRPFSRRPLHSVGIVVVPSSQRLRHDDCDSSVSFELTDVRNNVWIISCKVKYMSLTCQSSLFGWGGVQVWNKDTSWFILILFIYLSNNVFYIIWIITYSGKIYYLYFVTLMDANVVKMALRCPGLIINLSWSKLVSSLLWTIVSFTDTLWYQRRKLNPYHKINKLRKKKEKGKERENEWKTET